MAAAATTLQAVQIPPPNAGVDLVSAPENISAQGARALANYLPDRPGKMIPRGPLVGAALGGSVDTVGAIATPSTVLIGKKTSTVGRRLYPWETHLGLPGRSAVAETDLVRADVNLRSVDLGSFAAADQALVDIGLVPGPRSTQLGGLTYAISLDSVGELAGGDTALLANGTNLVRKTEILSFDFSGGALPTFPNPSFDTNTTGWAIAGTSITLARDTTTSDTAPASGLVTNTDAGASHTATLTTTTVGTFKAGRAYTLSFRVKREVGGGPSLTATLGAIGSIPVHGLSSSYTTEQMTFTPPTDTVNPVLTITLVMSRSDTTNVDSFTITQTTINKLGSTAPMCAQDITAYLSRLFVLGGAAPGSTPSALALKHSTLWWSDPGGPLTRVLTEWEDDVTGLVNQIQVGDEDPTDPGVALGRLPAALVIFKRRSLWALRGSSPSNFTDRRVAVVGCLDPRSVVECHDSVYWLSEQGFMSYDGSTLTNLSRQIQPALLAAADQSVGVGGVAGGTAVATELPNGYIKLAIGRRDMDTQLFLGYYHIPTGAWTTFSSGAQVGCVRTAFNANGAGYFADASTLWLANGATLPERNPVADKGVTLPDVSVDRIATVVAGVLTTASTSKITPALASRMVSLASPLYGAKLHRVLIDYTWVDPDQTNDDVSTGWHIVVRGSKGESLAAADLPTSGTATAHPIRRRTVLSVVADAASDIWVELSVPGAAPKYSGTPELYAVTVEYEQTRQRSTQ